MIVTKMKKLILIASLLFVNACSTYVEEANNKEFKPLTPSFEEFNKKSLVMVLYLVQVLLVCSPQIGGQRKLEIFYL